MACSITPRPAVMVFSRQVRHVCVFAALNTDYECLDASPSAGFNRSIIAAPVAEAEELFPVATDA